MHFFVWSRAAGPASDDPALDEEHQRYMDAFAPRMIARGPTLSHDRTEWTGSVHVVDLPGPETALAFAEQEPYHLAGRYAEHVILRYDDRLGRTMWQGHTDRPQDPTYLVVAGGAGTMPDLDQGALMRSLALGAVGPSDEPAGVVWIVQAPDRDEVESVTASWRGEVEVHDWEPGGRR